MTPVPSVHLLKALRNVTARNPCKQCLCHEAVIGPNVANVRARFLHKESIQSLHPTPLRKHMKDEARAQKTNNEAASKRSKSQDVKLEKWKLTVGIEIHAELDTVSKLFSPARTSLSDTPNEHVSLFDAAMPGAQPQLQIAALLPALRAALALGCDIQSTSGWDRKHYFWWDQPNGYQITQYYEPFAKAGQITLYQHDDIDPSDQPSVTVGIKQIQLEQDTAKTVLQPPSTYLLDFNRASHPLIEIITLPQIHSPKTAVALVKKIQTILKAVGANTTGMEMGGLRADVNVSVQPAQLDSNSALDVSFEYDGVAGLGQRTEIKNLSSFKAVHHAIIAERDRQISVLEAGGVIEGETRGWTLGSTETKRLRGKQGEVDYRYMPDPDLSTLRIGQDLVDHLRDTLPALPDDSLRLLTEDPTHGLTMKDARTMISLDDGDRLEFYLQTLALVKAGRPSSDDTDKTGRLVANWVLHDLPTYLTSINAPYPYEVAAPTEEHIMELTTPVLSSYTIAAILVHLLNREITTPIARRLLSLLALPDPASAAAPSASEEHLELSNKVAMQQISQLIDKHDLRLLELTPTEYVELVQRVMKANPDMTSKVRDEMRRVGVHKAKGKIMWLIGQMIRESKEGSVQPGRAEEVVRELLMKQ